MTDLSKRQLAELEGRGFTYAAIPVTRGKRATFYTLDKRTGALVTIPNLPSDERNLAYYLAKGFKLDPKELKQTVAQAQEGVKYVCQVCSRSFQSQQSLAGHSNKHKGKK